MKLYDSRRAPNPRRVRWVMAEKGIEDIQIVSVDIFKGEHRTPEYVAMAGLPHVPVLELDDGVALSESLAICRYLESLYPDPNLFGRGAFETGIIEMWTRRAEMMFATPLMLTVRHTHPALAALETQNPSIAAANRSQAEQAMSTFNERLKREPFLAGERITIADIVAFISLDFARMVQIRVPETLTSLARWADEMRARPAARAGV
jgi:glutathione S-transferase